MNEVISTFHIDVQLLIAQAVNFAIVFVVLYYFGIKPLLKILTERSKKIADSLKNSDKIAKELASTQAKREEIVRQAKQDASAIIADMEAKGEERKKEMLAKAKAEIEKIVTKTKDDLEVEKKIMLKHVKEEAAEMIVGAMEKILSKRITSEDDERLIEETVKELRK
ncbi:MAG: F0F1 ATP synthase subunit B [Methanoregula sp.]|jgi:F-type H+-transporting ATPase subunit b|nr:F0F1 ATP synthase subunit B [Methanoregula sp.]